MVSASTCERTSPSWPTTYSVLLTSRNEGDRLRRTVDSILRSGPPLEMEVVIIDDASSDGSAGFAREEPYCRLPIRVERNQAPRGLIYGRARGADLARGRYLAFLDAHCSVPEGWLERLRAELDRIGARGLVVPGIYKLRASDWSLDLEAGGAEGCTISSPFLDFAWTPPLLLEGRLATCTIGGGAWMCSREWYRHVGGLDRSMRVWGGENIDLPLRTWISGGWCLVAPQVKVGHLYNETPSNFMADSEFVYNKIRVAHNVFSRETFVRVLEALRYLQGFREAIARVHSERRILGVFKDLIESRRKRPDSWLIETFRLPLLEPPFFYFAPRRTPKPGEQPRRPSVSLVVVARPGEEECARDLTASLLERSTYRNAEVLLVLAGGRREAALPAEPGDREHPRFRALLISPRRGGGNPENLAARASAAEYLALLPARSVLLDENWIERFLLLAERRPRLLLACPRTSLFQADPGGPAPADDLFDASWDWDAPGLTRVTRGAPPEESPYQALSVPDGILFLHRGRFLELGGFDSTVGGAGRPVLDLALRGWLRGYQVLCHPGIHFGLAAPPSGAASGGDQAGSEPWRQYAAALPALTSFSREARTRLVRERCAEAEPLIREHRGHLERRRAENLARARFDDDWLFYKFGIEDRP